MSTQYEFTEPQNQQIGSLAGNMKFVGFFSVLFGLFALVIALLLTAFIFRDRLPEGFREKSADYYAKVKEKLPEDLQKQAEDYSLDKIPKNHQFLWGVVIFSGVTGLIFLLQGVWTRASGASFQQIVDTKGSDITNLMNAIGALQSMYRMIFMLLALALIGVLVAVGMTVYHYFGPH